MPTIDEKTRRRPPPLFLGGQPVRLADGQEWTIPKPRVRFTPDDGPQGFTVYLTLNDEYQDRYRRREDAYQRPDDDPARGVAILKADLALAACMLTTNYDLTPAEVGTLVQFGYDPDGDPEGAAIREDMIAIATGDAPKPRAGTQG